MATCFGIGYLRPAPGTLGTLFGLILVYALRLEGIARLFFGGLLIVIAIWSSEVFSKKSGEKDPQSVVIDEVAGVYMCFLLVEPQVVNLALGFFIFRALDMLKPFPIGLFERLPGGFGIVLDDVVAGLISGAMLRFLID
ncbi:MAG: phosphatidylglycerophosphatase A [Aquificaceae bacterium]|nr:phosphatidylglycerophosphatase A [Aquificaceae bacterium]